MTTPWTITPEWKGQTVAILASGPSMCAELAEQVRASADRVIAVKDTHRLAPWADMLVRSDGNWPQDYRDFHGMRVSCCPDDTLDALFPGWMWERVTTGGANLEIRNSGLAAVRIAAAMGARRIVLAGFEPEAGRRWHDAEQGRTRAYVGVAEALTAIRAELAAQGVVVEDFKAPEIAPQSPEDGVAPLPDQPEAEDPPAARVARRRRPGAWLNLETKDG